MFIGKISCETPEMQASDGPSPLNLSTNNKEMMMGQVTCQFPLSRSDHVILMFDCVYVAHGERDKMGLVH